jgi:hypothetical protein
VIDADLRVPCECCDATGRRALNHKESNTLAKVTAEWQTTVEILYLLRNVGQGALLYRLGVLVAHGFVERAKAGEAFPGGKMRGLAWRRKP